MKKTLLIIYLMSLFILHTTAIAEEQSETSKGYKIVVHPENPVEEFKRKDLSKIYLGRKVLWDSGERIIPVMLSEENPVIPIFIKNVLRKNVAQYNTYWKRRLLTGNGKAPKTFATALEVLEFVSQHPGAIGIVDPSVDLNEAPFSTKEPGGAFQTTPAESSVGTTTEGLTEPSVQTVDDQIFDLFVANVWPQIEQRCAGCHSQRSTNLQQLVDGPVDNFRWVFDTPEDTFDSIINNGLVDTEIPEESYILLKPTMQIAHGGEEQIQIGSRTYKQIRRWVENFAAVENEEYETADELPSLPEVEFMRSEIWLQIKSTPEAWGDKLFTVLVFPVDESTSKFSTTPVAGADSRVSSQMKLWQQVLSLYIPKGIPQAQQLKESRKLPEGRYRLQFFCDVENKLEEAWDLELASPEFLVGEKDIVTSWEIGEKHKTVVSLQDESANDDKETVLKPIETH